MIPVFLLIFVLISLVFAQTFAAAGADDEHNAVPSVMQAAASDIVDSGTCGDNLTWTLDKNGTLTIDGAGEMESYYAWDSRPPWGTYLEIITKAVIKPGVTSIGDRAFSWCRSLTDVTIGNSVTRIGESAFRVCDSLTDIEVSPNNEYYLSIDGVVFDKSATSLICFPAGRAAQYVIPDGVTSIGNWAFYNCNNLTSITIPDNVTHIGYSAFSGCDSLKNVYYNGTKEQWNDISIGESNDSLTSAQIHCD